MKRLYSGFVSLLIVATIATGINADVRKLRHPDAHAPIWVMGDHIHKVGEWMLSYRYMGMTMSGNRTGVTPKTTADVLTDYMVAPKEMRMTMHMVGAMHALSHPIGAIYNTHHGMTNAVLMPFVLDWNRITIEDRINNLSRHLNIKGGFDGFRNWIIQLRKNIGVPDGLAGIGVDATKFSLIAEMSLLDPSKNGNPRKLNFDGALEILNLAL